MLLDECSRRRFSATLVEMLRVCSSGTLALGKLRMDEKAELFTEVQGRKNRENRIEYREFEEFEIGKIIFVS